MRERIAPFAERWLALPGDAPLHAALLVARAEESALAAQTSRVNTEFAGLAELRLSGPWPPYNFVPALRDLDPAGHG